MALPALQKGLLREQLDKHTTFANTLSEADKRDLEDFELEALAFDAALNDRKTIFGKRKDEVIKEYRELYQLGNILGKDNGFDEIQDEEKIAVYVAKHSETTLVDKALKDAAEVEFITECDLIDADVNKDYVADANKDKVRTKGETQDALHHG